MSDDKEIWDDSLLVKAYDDSVNLAGEALARRIAAATNRNKEAEDNTDQASTSEPEQDIVFKVGDYARATYTDGLDYEGVIESLDEWGTGCVLRYLGYENEQKILLTKLLPSWGSKARREQVKIAKQEQDEEEKQQAQSAKPAKKAAAKGKQERVGPPAGLVMPPMPLVPPMFSPTGGMLGEPEQDFVAMLTAWYMSGYYTGLYQGKKEGAKKKSTKK